MKKFAKLAAVIMAVAQLALAEDVDFSQYNLTQLYRMRTQLEHEIQTRIAASRQYTDGYTQYYDMGDVSVALSGFRIQSVSGKNYMLLFVKWLNNSDEPTAYYIAASVDAYQNGVELDDGYISGVEKDSTRKVLPGYGTTVTEIYELENKKDPVIVTIKPWLDLRNEYPPQQIMIEIK